MGRDGLLRGRLLTAFTVAGVAMCVVAGGASAAVIHPTRTDDPTTGGNSCTPTPTDCSLRNAILTGDTVSLAPPAPAGPYTLTGEIELQGGTTTIIGVSARSSVIDQTAAQSVFDVRAATLSLTGVTVAGGQAHDGGAGIYNEGTVILNGVTVTNNLVTALATGTNPVYGAGIYNLGSLTVENSTITGNTVVSSFNTSANEGVLAYGGGIANVGSGASASISNSTITGNSADMTQEDTGGAGGGGIYSSGLIKLANVTLAANNGDVGGGNLFLNTGASAEIDDTIVAGGTSTFNSPQANCLSQGGGAIIQEAYNLEDHNECGFTGTGDEVNVNPGLGKLVNNGGGTDTMAIPFSSPAVDHGNPAGCTSALGAPLTTDQRGIARPQGPACDVGAFELAYHTLTVSKKGSGGGTVRSTDATIACGPRCSHTYAAGETVTLTAKPASGSQFTGWSGACTGSGTCHVKMTGDKRVTATFKKAGPPNTSITDADTNRSKQKATFEFTGSGGVGALHFQCKLDSGNWKPCTSPTIYTGLTHASHRFEVRAIDARGEADPTPAVHNFTT